MNILRIEPVTPGSKPALDALSDEIQLAAFMPHTVLDLSHDAPRCAPRAQVQDGYRRAFFGDTIAVYYGPVAATVAGDVTLTVSVYRVLGNRRTLLCAGSTVIRPNDVLPENPAAAQPKGPSGDLFVACGYPADRYEVVAQADHDLTLFFGALVEYRGLGPQPVAFFDNVKALSAPHF